MKTYKVLSSVTVQPDKIRLTKAQAELRAHLVRPAQGASMYTPIAPLCFKAGEVIGLSDLEKVNAAKFEEVVKDDK